MTASQRLFRVLIVINVVLVVLILSACSMFDLERAFILEFGEPPENHKWMYTVEHYDDVGNLDALYISDIAPAYEKGVYIVYDGSCNRYELAGKVNIYASEAWETEPVEGICI